MPFTLLLIDIQNDYFPGGKNPLEGSLEASLHARAVLERFRHDGLPVVHIRHHSLRPGASFFLPGTPGADIHASVHPLPNEPAITKNYPNSFRSTALLETLRQVQAGPLVIAGSMTHMCVDATVRAAADIGFECILLHNACATKALTFAGETVPAAQVQAAFLAALASTYARVTGATEFLAEFHSPRSTP